MAKKTNFLANRDAGFIQNLTFQLRLIWRLMKDGRVSFFLKLLPVGALIYLVSPIDLLPGVTFPVIGALDDAVVLWLGATLFVSLCPEEVVKEHTDALQSVIKGTWRDVSGQEGPHQIIESAASEDSRDEP